jgi:hypothetical protein
MAGCACMRKVATAMSSRDTSRVDTLRGTKQRPEACQWHAHPHALGSALSSFGNSVMAIGGVASVSIY